MKRVRVIFALVAVSGAACQLLAGIERVEKQETVYLDGGQPEAAPDVVIPPDPCAHALPPGPPASDDGPDLGPTYLALRTFKFLATRDGGEVDGYDLDGVCTCDTEPNTAEAGAPACGPNLACDGPGGIDNAVTAQLSAFGPNLDIETAVDIQYRIDSGTQNILILVTDYNGRANDKQVHFAFIPSNGIIDAGASKCIDAGEPFYDASFDLRHAPGWCGDDPWTLDRDSVSTGSLGIVPLYSLNGYVTNYQMVIRGEEHDTVAIGFAGGYLSIGTPIVTGKIVRLGDDFQPVDPSAPLGPTPRFRFDDGIISGRVAAKTILLTLAQMHQPGLDAAAGVPPPLCQNAEQMVFVKSQLCGALDTNVDDARDFKGDHCNAISMAMHVTAFPVATGAVIPNDVQPPDCSNLPSSFYQCQ